MKGKPLYRGKGWYHYQLCSCQSIVELDVSSLNNNGLNASVIQSSNVNITL